MFINDIFLSLEMSFLQDIMTIFVLLILMKKKSLTFINTIFDRYNKHGECFT